MTTDIIAVEEAEVPHDPTWAVTQAGTAALASMTESDFQDRLAALQAGRERITVIQRALMTPGEDYGTVGDVKKPTLLKPGAEKLCDFYRLAADFVPTVTYGDGVTSPPIAVVMRCQLHLGDFDGPIVGAGYGQANSWERRYRYRRGERTCLLCGKPGRVVHTSRKSWWHPQDKGGCGQSLPDNDPRVAAWLAQSSDDVENPDPHDLANTLVKMAEKRAHIDATLRATATSGLFTQDVEDISQERQDIDPHTGEILSKPVVERQTLRQIAEEAATTAEGPHDDPGSDIPPQSNGTVAQDTLDAAWAAEQNLSAVDTVPLFPEAPGASDSPEDLTDEELRNMVRHVLIPMGTVAATAKRLFPGAKSSADLNDAQRGQLFAVLMTEKES